MNVSIAKIGSKGVFTAEIEEQLANGDVDIAVHSAKDMPSSLPQGFELIAFMERERPTDVIISHNKDFTFDHSSDILLGTASTRRVATLARYYPNVSTISVRGNLQTRIRKMEVGACDALLLAYAGVHRMGYEDMIVAELPLNEFIPAVGQGSVAVEVHERLENDKKEAIRSALNHEQTETCLLAERAFLKTIDGGCSIPVFAMATLIENQIALEGGIVSMDGKERIVKRVVGALTDHQAIGNQLANEVLASGGKEILEEIKK